MKKYILMFLSILLLLNIPVHTQEVSKVGTTAAPFLNIDVGSRAVAMGGAYTAVAGDVTAMYWNPAGIAQITQFESIFCHSRWIADLSINYAGAVLPMGNLGTLGVSAMFFSMDEMERTTINSPDGTGEMFDAGSYAFGLSYARNLTDRFSIGGSVKYISERLYHCNASGMAVDVGTLFDTNFNGLKIGMSISNYGTKMQMLGRDTQIQADIDPRISGNNANINANLETDAYDLPLMFRVGLSMDVLKGIGNSNLILSVDALHPNDDVESVNVGGEFIFNNLVSLRAGYKSLFARDSEAGLNFGGGVQYEIMGTRLYIDYAYVDFGMLNNVQMFTLGLGL